MNDLLDELKKYVGVESEPIVYFIDAGAIKFFAESIMDPDPLYRDEDYARKTKHKGIVASPTFYGGATSLRNVKAGDARTVAMPLPRPDGWASLNAGDDFELLSAIKPGDTLTCREKVVDVYEKKGRSGHLIFTTTEKTFTNQHGQVVLIRRGTGVWARQRKEKHHQ